MTLIKNTLAWIRARLTLSPYWRTVTGVLLTVLLVHGIGSLFIPDYSSFGAMLVYATVGIILISLIDKLWIKSHDILHALFVEKNIAVGLVVLGICIIIAAAITRS